MKEDVNKGEWDFTLTLASLAGHFRWPGTMSRAGAAEVRSGTSSNIYGLPGNSPQQQAEADKGTRMATQACGDL